MNVPLRDWRPVARGPGAASPRAEVKADHTPSPLPAHAGLWLERMLHEPKPDEKEKPGRQALHAATVSALGPSGPVTKHYSPYFARWRASLVDGPGVRVRLCELEATSRVLLHTASNQSVTDGGLLLHHTYGVPYLPGSALKGVLRRAVERSSGGAKLAAALFGPDRAVPGYEKAADLRGYLDVLDALWVPGTGCRASGGSPLALDIVNPHHPDWYTRENGVRRLAADHDSPVPTHRLSLAPGARFLLAVEWAGSADEDPFGPTVERLIGLLLDALEHDGLGSWTSVGYGRFRGVGESARVISLASRRAAPPPLPWQPARLERDPPTRRLKAILASGVAALAEGREADRLFSALPEEAQRRLKERKAVALQAQVELLGRQWRIVGLRPA